MTPEAQRIAIGSACGKDAAVYRFQWKSFGGDTIQWSPSYSTRAEAELVASQEHEHWGSEIWPVEEWQDPDQMPRYTESLDAMAQAEKVLTLDQRVAYGCLLANRCNDEPIEDEDLGDIGDDTCRWSSYAVVNGAMATAAQRAEAFLRVIGRWVES